MSCLAIKLLFILITQSFSYLDPLYPAPASTTMDLLTGIDPHTDPTAELSPRELVQLLMNHNYITTKEYVKEYVDSEREHTNAKISSMADSLVSSLMNLYKKVADNSAANRSTIEEANIKLETIDEKLAELNLKIETYGLYHHQIISNLKTGIQ